MIDISPKIKPAVQKKFDLLKQALATLEQALSIEPNKLTELERDGTIQRFEFCLELTWKLVRTVVQDQDVKVYGPKDTFRHAARLGLVKDVETWFSFLRARNETSHVYSQMTAEYVYKKAKEYNQEVKDIISTIKPLI